MKGRTLIALMLTAAFVVGCGSSSSSTTSTTSPSAGGASTSGSPGASTTASTGNCKASIAIEGPFTGPVSAVGLEQLYFAQLAVANDNKLLGTNVTLAQDDTQLTPSIAIT